MRYIEDIQNNEDTEKSLIIVRIDISYNEIKHLCWVKANETYY
jgi:hypothetical protein